MRVPTLAGVALGMLTLAVSQWHVPVFGADEAVLRPRVPVDQIAEARTWTNPFPSTDEHLEQGRALFHGKAFWDGRSGNRPVILSDESRQAPKSSNG